ncbi:MAG: hypothetical protein CSA34_02965 [Desulfobulbus propionicus]|nr:MAG: hypothetical protein CSA34_02965 [Desulfobulbus propionicus]
MHEVMRVEYGIPLGVHEVHGQPGWLVMFSGGLCQQIGGVTTNIQRAYTGSDEPHLRERLEDGVCLNSLALLMMIGKI